MAETNDNIKKDDLKRVKDVSSKLLKLLGSKSKVKVTEDKEKEAIKEGARVKGARESKRKVYLN